MQSLDQLSNSGTLLLLGDLSRPWLHSCGLPDCRDRYMSLLLVLSTSQVLSKVLAEEIMTRLGQLHAVLVLCSQDDLSGWVSLWPLVITVRYLRGCLARFM